MSQYAVASPNAGSAEMTGSPVLPPQAEGQAGDQKPLSDANVTPQAAADPSVLSREEHVEYRDQDGNLLNEEQVASLQGKVAFQTRYETRTRVVDAAGNEVAEGPAGAEGFAPPHPDVEGRNPETAGDGKEGEARDQPATASVGDDIGKEMKVEQGKGGQPRPASEGNEATK
jgi:dolichyl-phosphate-mannose-protein mannosyltransferase